MEDEDESSRASAPAVDVGTLEVELSALSSIGSYAVSSLDETQAWNDWMQDADLDP